MKNIVSKEWLLDNLFKENIIILDVRYDMNNSDYGRLQYEENHIPRAQFVSFDDVLVGEIKEHGGRHPLPDMYKFIEDMNKYGINHESLVVVYDDGTLEMAGRLWWMLRYAGKKEVYVLEGGIKSCKRNNFVLTNEVIKPYSLGMLILDIDNSMVVDMDYVKENSKSPSIAIVDSRAYERYIGKVEPIDKIPGHIPNAINYPWTNLLENEQLFLYKELTEYFHELEEFQEIIVHCGSGITGTVNVMAMDEIGLKPKLYVGGYSDWISYSDNKIAKE